MRLVNVILYRGPGELSVWDTSWINEWTTEDRIDSNPNKSFLPILLGLDITALWLVYTIIRDDDDCLVDDLFTKNVNFQGCIRFCAQWLFVSKATINYPPRNQRPPSAATYYLDLVDWGTTSPRSVLIRLGLDFSNSDLVSDMWW